jgi:hypothetical protein
MDIESIASRARNSVRFLLVAVPVLGTACTGKGLREAEEAPGVGGTMTHTVTGGSSGSSGSSATGGVGMSGGTAGSTSGSSGLGGSVGGASPGTGGASSGTGGAGAMASGGTGGQISGSGGSSGTASVTVREPLPCFADMGTPAEGDLTLALDANRLSGVAPLGVFFDTAGTTATSTDQAFLDLAYCWDFDDPDSGSFPTTGLPRNQAKGGVASHVFERPGTYSVTVSARDRMGRVSSRAIDITVQDPNEVYAGAATVCFSSSGDFEGCPEGAAQQTISDFGEVEAHVETGRRLLLRRGDTFSGNGGITLNVPGPGIVGAYGEGDRPLIQLSTVAIVVSGQRFNFNDWRVADLNFEGTSPSAEVISVQGRANDLTVLRVRGSGIGRGIGAGLSTIDVLNESGFPGHDVIDGLFIQDSEFVNLVGGAGRTLGFIAAHRLVMLGATWRNSLNGEHVLRTTWVDRGVFSSNDMGEAPDGKTVWKLHAPDFESNSISAGKYSERIVVSDNIFRMTGPHVWTVVIGPQNTERDERIRQLVFERNMFLPGPTALIALTVSAQDVVIRDNIVNHARGRCFSVGQTGLEPAPARVWLTNNTCYNNEAGALEFMEIGPNLDTIVAANNLLSGVDAGEDSFPVSEATEALTNAVLPPSIFVGDDFDTDWQSFELAPGSGAIDVGSHAAASAWDFSGRPRASDGDSSGSAEPDLGALEVQP